VFEALLLFALKDKRKPGGLPHLNMHFDIDWGKNNWVYGLLFVR
jgi:hypothetical protein